MSWKECQWVIHKKKNICNNEQQRLGPAQALLMANPIGNLLTPLVTDKEDTVTENPFENPMMAQSILKLTKSQTYFLKALGEEQTAQISEAYVRKLESGTALGQDDLEKILVLNAKTQELINKKMKNVVLDENAKKLFSQGISYYAAGTAMLATASVSAASMASGIGANPVGIIQGISVFFTAKDALTTFRFFFSSTNNLLDFFGKEQNLENIEELQSAKNSLGV